MPDIIFCYRDDFWPGDSENSKKSIVHHGAVPVTIAENRRFRNGKRRFLFVFAQNLMSVGLRSNMVLTCL